MSEKLSIQDLLTQHLGAEIAEMQRQLELAADKVRKIAEPYIGKAEAAAYLNICVNTLEKRMALPDGPPRYTDGGKVSFLRSELRVWRRQWRAGDQTGLEEHLNS